MEGPGGGSPKWYYPPGFLPKDERTIEYERDLKPTSIAIGIGHQGDIAPRETILQGNTIFRFKVDYYDLFKNLEISDYDFLKFIVLQNEYEIPSQAKDVIQKLSWDDKGTFEDLHPDIFMRYLIIDNINHDLVVSILLNSAVIMDSGHEDLLKRKCWHP